MLIKITLLTLKCHIYHHKTVKNANKKKIMNNSFIRNTYFSKSK